MGRRIMGKASFVELMDAQGVYRSTLPVTTSVPERIKNSTTPFSRAHRYRNFIGITGYVFRTKTGEISVRKAMTILSKITQTTAGGKSERWGHVR